MEPRHCVAGALPWVLAASVWLTGCKDQKTSPEVPASTPPAAESAHADELVHDELPKRVHLTKEVISAAKITTAPVVREALETVLELPGEIAADPDRSPRRSPAGSTASRSPKAPQ